MDKKTYMSELTRRLAALPRQEREEVLQDYEEHFEYARLNGREERAVVQSLGEPQLIAREILTQFNITLAEYSPSASNIAKAVMTAFGHSAFHLLVLLAPFMAGVVALTAVYIFAAFLIASPLLLLVQDGFGWVYAQEFPLSLGVAGVGLLLWLGAMRGTKLFYRWMMLYLKFALSKNRRGTNEIRFEKNY